MATAAGGEPSPAAAAAAAAAKKKSLVGQPWSHLETVHLIDAYEERWTAMRRGQLKAQQWEDVAAAVAARCAAATGAAPSPPKSGTQCRHKIEKLRKRFRAERARPVASLWPYFRPLERLERGTLAVPAFPPSFSSAAAAADDREDEEELPPSNTRSINGILRESGSGARPPPAAAPPRKRAAFEAFGPEPEAPVDEEEDEEENEVAADAAGLSAMSQLAAAVRKFGEGMLRVERRRMEVRREMEREWMEMEARRAEMLIEAQRRLVESIAAAFAADAAKKARREHGGGDS